MKNESIIKKLYRIIHLLLDSIIEFMDDFGGCFIAVVSVCVIFIALLFGLFAALRFLFS